MYDFGSNTWGILPAMLTPLSSHGCGLARKTDGTREAVIAGGSGSNVQIYRFDTNSWR